MATKLLDAVTTPTTGSASSFSAPGSLYIRGLNGGKVAVDISPDAGDDSWGILIAPGSLVAQCRLDIVGPYRLRARLTEVTAQTSCTVTVEQDP